MGVLVGKILVLFLIPIICVFSYADQEEELGALVKKYHYRHSFHGNVLVRKNGEVFFEKSIGMANAEWNVPHTKDSKFMIASLSKSFTAAMILVLEKSGELSVEDLVSDYISQPVGSIINQDRWSKLQIKHLLNHTGGLKRDFSNVGSLNRSGQNRLKDIVFHSFSNKPIFISNPGEKFYYSNFGYVLLAAIIEEANSHDYENTLKNHILRDAGIYDTGEFHRMKYLESMSSGYLYGSSRRISKRCCDDATSLRGAASLYSTTTDLANWLRLIGNSSNLLGFNLVESMFRDTIDGEAEGTRYGYGLMRSSVSDTVRIYHTGHEWGFVSSMSLYPAEKLEIVVLANRHGFMGDANFNSADSLSLDIAKQLLSH